MRLVLLPAILHIALAQRDNSTDVETVSPTPAPAALCLENQFSKNGYSPCYDCPATAPFAKDDSRSEGACYALNGNIYVTSASGDVTLFDFEEMDHQLSMTLRSDDGNGIELDAAIFLSSNEYLTFGAGVLLKHDIDGTDLGAFAPQVLQPTVGCAMLNLPHLSEVAIVGADGSVNFVHAGNGTKARSTLYPPVEVPVELQEEEGGFIDCVGTVITEAMCVQLMYLANCEEVLESWPFDSYCDDVSKPLQMCTSKCVHCFV